MRKLSCGKVLWFDWIFGLHQLRRRQVLGGGSCGLHQLRRRQVLFSTCFELHHLRRRQVLWLARADERRLHLLRRRRQVLGSWRFGLHRLRRRHVLGAVQNYRWQRARRICLCDSVCLCRSDLLHLHKSKQCRQALVPDNARDNRNNREIWELRLY